MDTASGSRYGGVVGLESFEKSVRHAVVVLALHGRASSRSNWQDLVRSARPGGGQPLYGEELKRATKGLVEAGLVVPVGGGFEIAAEHLARVLDEAADRQELPAVPANVDPYALHYRSIWRPTARLRRALASRNRKDVELALLALRAGWEQVSLAGAIGLQPSARWVELLGEPTRTSYLREALEAAFVDALRVSDGLLEAARASDTPEIVARAATVLALRGETDAALPLVEGREDAWGAGAWGLVLLTQERWAEARAAFRVAASKARGAREVPSYLAPLAWLALLTDESTHPIDGLLRNMRKSQRQLRRWPEISIVLEALADQRATGRSAEADVWARDWLSALFMTFVKNHAPKTTFSVLHDHAAREGYRWLADELGRAARQQPISLSALRTVRPAWERALDALASVATQTQPREAPSEATLVWELDVHTWGLQADAYAVAGRSRKGKRLSLASLTEDPTLAVDERDRRIAAMLIAGRYHHSGFRTLLLFEGHPRVRDADGEPLAIVRGQPALRVESRDGALRIRLEPERFNQEGLAISKQEHTITIYEQTPDVQRLHAVVGESGLALPKAAARRATEVLAALSSKVTVHAPETGGALRSGDPRPCVQLFRVGESLRARLRVRPAGSLGVALRPGMPPGVIAVADAAGLESVRRDLEAEREEANGLLDRCPVLASLPSDGEDRVASDPAASLEVLLELAEAGATLEWPEGQALRAPTLVREKNVRLRVGGTTSWLELSGEVTVDEQRVIAMSELVASMSRARGRFVPIGEGEWAALTEDLRSKLETLGRVQALGSEGRVSAALLPALEGLVSGFDVELGEQAESARDALRRAESMTPDVPRCLEGVLRDYQRDGFLFLARRAEAGLGACLADDMGLGKTLQALALLVHRGAGGPALVVCPTSVCRNWEDEARRFAPELRVRRLHEGDRRETITEATAHDVVIASYGLLVVEEELLGSRRWSTIVLDEAHALKNASTRRWAAARKLSAGAVIGLTGTPLENHAGELHAIFDVLVPGLLGSRGAFDRAIGSAIAEGRREAASALRQLVRPLLLRRTKAQVLAELPPKTEMTRLVTPSPDHLAFYEALRRRALARAEGAVGQGKGRGRIEILAELMRLRRAAIDPRLVGGDDAPEGPKIEALARILGDLREEGHRALVFSQFLEVLDLARERLDALGITSLRLDGSMGPEERASQVAAFQGGKADAFLLSLKAGGVGMNLTAADYVIHLDPWWNPAVEDQATDRAHRFGQTRPITVIRLVTESTIEEKVLALHDKKRKLYEDVVSAADGAGTLDVELLVELLGDGPPSRGGTAAALTT